MSTTRARRPGASTRSSVVELRDGQRLEREDRVITEEPLEMRIVWPGAPALRMGITMRTPGHDFELAAGWMVHEGVTVPSAIRSVQYCTDEDLTPEQEFNVVTVTLAGAPRSVPAARMVSSACGVCGSDSVGEVLQQHVPPAPVELASTTVLDLPDRLREQQAAFGRTGGVHAAGLFETDGTRVVVREDVGRHNAVDKAVGSRLLHASHVPPVLVLSGRIGFELVQKAVVSGIGAVVAVGAPTSVAVDLARDADLVLVGFTRAGRCVVYSGASRVH